eukprot:m.46431 g.46431  ORF g.46431 m.46431 type:complete len:300 (-) comp13150_c0_seq4:112-1011(-)
MRNLLQVIAIPVLLLLGVVSALLPRWLSKSSRSPDIPIQLGTCLAAGVFLSAGFLHLLPEAVDDDNSLDKDFPYIYLAALGGYVIVFLLDFVSHAVSEKSNRAHDSYEVLSHTPTANVKSNGKNGEKRSLLHERPLSPSATAAVNLDPSELVRPRSTIVVCCVHVALSIHSIIAGLALGTSSDTATAVFIAIIAHKGLAGFSLGVEIHGSSLGKWMQVTLIAIFAAATPLGTVIGLYAGMNDSEYLVIIQAVSAGTFIFIGGSHLTSEMKERCPVVHLGYQIIMFIIGLGFMGVLAIWA